MNIMIHDFKIYMPYFLVSLVFASSLSAQNIRSNEPKRKALFGAYIAGEDSLLHAFILGEIMPNSTAAELGLIENDRIHFVNGQKTSSYKEFSAIWSNFREGDTLEIKLQRNKQTLVKKGTCSAKPMESSENYAVEYGFVRFKEGLLRTITTIPKGKGKKPALLFIPGYTCVSVDNMGAKNPYSRMIKGFTEAGFVVMRIEKPGLGDSYQTGPCEEIGLLEETAAFETGLLHLKERQDIDTSQVFIWGHSMGGVIAPLLASKISVKGIMAYGTTAKSWFEYILEMNRLQTMLSKPNPIEFENYCQTESKLAYEFYIKNTPTQELLKDSVFQHHLKTYWEYDGNNHVFGRSEKYWREIQHLNLVEAWKNTNADILIQFGESDFQAFSLADHQQIVYTANFNNRQRARLITYPLTDHFMAKSGSMQNAFDKFTERKFTELYEAFNPEVLNTAINWSKELIKFEPQ